MKHLTFFSASALALVFGIGLYTLPAHAATATSLILTDTTKWSTGTTILQSLNLSTNKLTTLRKLPNNTTIRAQAFNGSRIVFSKNQDLYIGKITGGTDVRIAKFTGCTGDPSCTISAVSFSHSGRYVLYRYEGYYLYDVLTGRTTKITSSFNIQGISPTDRFYFDNGYALCAAGCCLKSAKDCAPIPQLAQQPKSLWLDFLG
jgi:Tol biopolymer transport system component